MLLGDDVTRLRLELAPDFTASGSVFEGLA